MANPIYKTPRGHFPQEKAVGRQFSLEGMVRVASSMTDKPISGGISVKRMSYLITPIHHTFIKSVAFLSHLTHVITSIMHFFNYYNYIFLLKTFLGGMMLTR